MRSTAPGEEPGEGCWADGDSDECWPREGLLHRQVRCVVPAAVLQGSCLPVVTGAIAKQLEGRPREEGRTLGADGRRKAVQHGEQSEVEVEDSAGARGEGLGKTVVL
jgi:hypothetical protein